MNAIAHPNSLKNSSLSDRHPRLFLAPMEGVTDWVMRDILSSLGGLDQCVTEFLRITDRLMPDHVFLKNCPELATQSKTRSGTPVFVQLLGGQAGPLSENAARLAELGAAGIDLNFGCPAPTVNRHDGGATLLKFTHRLYDIVNQVRKAVPEKTPVTAKMRLGFEDTSLCLENAKAIEEAGATWLTVHCRTKLDGYKPPAYWEWIPRISETVQLPVITNGEIWSVEDFEKCHREVDTFGYMVGRGAVRNPYLLFQIKQKLLGKTFSKTSESELYKVLNQFFDLASLTVSPAFATARTKGWLKQLAPLSDEIKTFFDQIKVEKDPAAFKRLLVKGWNQDTNFDNPQPTLPKP